MASEFRQSSVEDDGADARRQGRTKPFKANLDRVGIINTGVGQRQEVEDRVEVHAGDESSAVGQSDGTLAGEKLSRNHGMLGALPFPKDPGYE